MVADYKPYDEMTIPELREHLKGLRERQREADSAHNQLDTYLRNRINSEARELVAKMPPDEKDALREALREALRKL